MTDSIGWRGPMPQSAHAQRAYDRKVMLDKRTAEKRAAAVNRCQAGDHTIIQGRCIICQQPQ